MPANTYKLGWTAIALVFGGTLALAEEKASAPAVPVKIIVTVEPRHDKESPVLHREDFMVSQKNERLRVTDVVPNEGRQAPLELFVLIDDGSGVSLGSQLDDLRQFIENQPPATSIGIGYMRNGSVQIVQDMTADRQKAAKSLRLPFATPGIAVSPFLALSDMIKRWPASAARHEVLMLTSGVDPLGGGITDPYLDAAIEHAQRAGIVVYAIYIPGAGHAGHSYWRMNWGQNHLAQIAEETGGEDYMLGFGPPVSIAQYLSDITEHLAHQYVVTFQVTPGKKAGFQSIRVTTEVPGAELVTAGKVYVPANR